MKNILKITGVSKKYRNSLILNNINLTLSESDDLVILGPSGSGKTTLLQILGGLLSCDSGKVEIDGVDINRLNDADLSHFRNNKIGFIFQNNYLQEYLTAEENVMVPMLIAGCSISEARLRAFDLLKKVKLDHRSKNLPSELSGGEEQRVSIARALANNPKIILADEPTAKLDKANRDNILSLLKEINSDGVSMVLISHDPEYSKVFKNTITMDSINK